MGPDWRGPVADRLFLAATEEGRAVTDALIENYRIVNTGRALQLEPPITPRVETVSTLICQGVFRDFAERQKR